jgi:hypothetical protein
MFWDWSRDVVSVNNQPGSLLFFGFFEKNQSLKLSLREEGAS